MAKSKTNKAAAQVRQPNERFDSFDLEQFKGIANANVPTNRDTRQTPWTKGKPSGKVRTTDKTQENLTERGALARCFEDEKKQ